VLKEKSIFCRDCRGKGYLEDEDCNVCKGTGIYHISIGEDEIVFVNIYTITRHYGGPEEGGWWYNWSECREVIPVQNKYSDVMAEEAEKRYTTNGHKFGNIYSVLGGQDVDVRIEANPKESESESRPYYE
jgi:hypothetical protein